MAERRMFAKSIIESDAFLEMPHSAQSLYIHLSMRADDDGCVNNSKITMRTIGTRPKDLKILEEKRFILNFGDVIVIKHWRINNQIRNDRKRDSLYPEVVKKLSVKPNGAYTLKEEEGQDDNQVTTKWQPSDNQMATECPRSIGKYRIVESSIGEDSIYIHAQLPENPQPVDNVDKSNERLMMISKRILGE